MQTFFSLLLFFCFFSTSLRSELLFLRDHFSKAQSGDYIVALVNKTVTLMHIHDRQGNTVTIEEISIPSSRCSPETDWKKWVAQGAPKHSSWVIYDIDLQSGQLLRYYSFTKKNWFEIPDTDHFLSTLLRLTFVKIPDHARKKIGKVSPVADDPRNFWQPKMVVNGQFIPTVFFDAWQAKWPKDGGELSGKTIEMYLPQDDEAYLSYFPYWLQIKGMIGKATIRIIDSGHDLQSIKLFPPSTIPNFEITSV